MTSWLSGIAAKFNTGRRQLVAAADSMRDRGEPAAAADLYRQAIAAGEKSVGIRKQLANALKDSSQFEAALSEYQTCVSAEPDDADTYLQVGHLFKLRGDLAKAGEYYQRACRCPEPSTHAADELDLLRRSGAYRMVEPVQLVGSDDLAVRAHVETFGGAMQAGQRPQYDGEAVRLLAARVDALAQQWDNYGRQAAHPGYSIADQVFLTEARNRIDALLPMFLNMNSAVARLAAEVERLSCTVDPAPAGQQSHEPISTDITASKPVRQRNGAVGRKAEPDLERRGPEYVGRS